MSTLKETPFQLKMKIKRLQIGCKCQLRIHMSRHTFGTPMLSAGIPIESISKMMGHTNIRTTQIYARVTDDKISEDMDRLMEKKSAKTNISQYVYYFYFFGEHICRCHKFTVFL